MRIFYAVISLVFMYSFIFAEHIVAYVNRKRKGKPLKKNWIKFLSCIVGMFVYLLRYLIQRQTLTIKDVACCICLTVGMAIYQFSPELSERINAMLKRDVIKKRYVEMIGWLIFVATGYVLAIM